MLKDILDYEKKLLSDREELLKLTESHQEESDELISAKLKFMQQELEHMNHQYKILRTRVNLNEAQVNLNDAQVDPNGVQVNPIGAQVNLNKAQVNPIGAQINPIGAQVNPIEAQVNPHEAQVNPIEAQVNPHEAQVNPIEAQVNPHEAQVNPYDAQVNPHEAPMNPNDAQVNPHDVNMVAANSTDVNKVETESAQTINEQSQTTNLLQAEPQPARPKKIEKSLEKAIGSSLMGILASGLIFISLILFATIALPYMGDAVKLFGCYLISFALIGVSLFKPKKERKNKFYLSLAGCGVGALYISLLLTNIYFKYITDIPLFILITVWVAFVCYLSKAKNKIFHIIGQLGVTISILFGSVACTDSNDFAKFVSLTIFYIVAFGALYIMHFEKEAASNKTGNIFGCINLTVMFLASISFIEDSHYIYFFFMTVVALMHLVALFLAKWEKAKVSYGVFASIYPFIMALFATGFIKNDLLYSLIIYAFAIIILFAADFKPKTFQGGNIWIQMSMTLLAFIGLIDHDAVYHHGFVWLLIIPIVYLGFFRNRAVCRYMGLLLTFIYFFMSVSIAELVILSLLVMIGFYVLMYVKKEVYSFSFKICLHLLGVFFFLSVGTELVEEIIYDLDAGNALIYILIAVYNFAMARSIFSKNLKTKEPENMACYNIINLILMTDGLEKIGEQTALHIPVIIVTLVIFLLNSKNLLEKHQNFFAGSYVGLKFTILLITILNSFDAVNYVTSGLCIIFAIACIVIGFVRDYKYLRIYGLLLSMISVFKLVMIDIHYENTL